MADQQEPLTWRQRRLGSELASMRVNAGKEPEDVMRVLKCGQPKVSKLENGKVGIRPLELDVLFGFYGITNEEYKESIKKLARERNKVGWWSKEGPLLHSTDRDFLLLEEDSTVIRVFEYSLVPGLFQTERYMRRVFELHDNDEKVEYRTQIRKERQTYFEDRTSFKLQAVIDASVLHRMGGDPDLVAEQLEHLLAASKRRNVTLQVLPEAVPLPPQQWAPFHIFSLKGNPPMDIVWIEHRTGGVLLEEQEDVSQYSLGWATLSSAALTPSDTRNYIESLIKEVES